MNSSIRLSLILPCYNVEKYIAECLDSLYAQDIPESEYEVICVNDCSPDGTRDIIVAYQQKHPNLILIDHVVNKKQGAARNTGFNYARGKYIWFIDSDDYIKENVIGSLLKEIESNDLDILNFEMYLITYNNITIKNKITDSTDIITGKEFIHQLSDNWQINGSVSSKLFKRNYLIEIQLYFSLSNYLEDQIYSLRSVFYANRFRHLEMYCYYYRHNQDSTLNTRMTSEKYLSIFQLSSDLFVFTREIETNDPILYKSVLEIALWYLNSVVKQIIYFRATERQRAISCIKDKIPIIIHSEYFHGWPYFLFSHLSIVNSILYLISPFLRYTKQCKKYLKNKISLLCK